MPAIHPRDVFINIHHYAPQGRSDRAAALTVERAVDGLPLVQVTMSPDQFARLMSQQTVSLRSDVELQARPTDDQMTRIAASWFRPGDRVYPRSGGQVMRVVEVRPITGSHFRQQFQAEQSTVRPTGDGRSFVEGPVTRTSWLHSDEYQLAPVRPGEDSDTVRNAALVANLWREDSDPIIKRLVAQVDALVAEAREAGSQPVV